MADTTATVVEVESVSESENSATESNQPSGILMTYSHVPQPPSATITLGFNFNAMENSRRIITDNLSTTIGEISPLINLSRSRPAISLQEWFNPNHQRPSDSVVININNNVPNVAIETHQPSNNDQQQHSFPDNFPNNIQEPANAENQNNSNNNSQVNPAQPVAVSAEARFKTLESYLPFFTIVFTKFIYDNGAQILNFVLLVLTFIQANNDLKREITKQQNRSYMVLLGILCYIIGCFVFINFVFKEPLFNQETSSSLSDLVWTVVVTDYVLKLITVCIKVLITCIPGKILAFHKRGKYYLMVEATSQLYRCMSPLCRWFAHLFNIFLGPDKLLGIVLTVIYMAYKGGNLMTHLKLFFQAAWKMLQRVSLGTSPTKEQIVASGGICAICHDEYSVPVRLSCKHIFCEACVVTWLDRERSCPLCRASISDGLIYRDGHTTHYIQVY